VLVAVILCSLLFCLVNGVHDAGNAIAAPIVTHALSPRRALVLSAVFHFVGALLVGAAVAMTVAGIISVAPSALLETLGAAVAGALLWSLFTYWLGLPCSSGHCLVGALAGAGLAEGGWQGVRWGGLEHFRPTGVLGSLAWLFLSSAIAFPAATVLVIGADRALRRASRAVVRPLRRGETLTTAALSFAHGSNDAAKTSGLLALALYASGRLNHLEVPFAATLAAATTLSIGTSFGGKRVVWTLGRGIYRLRTLEGLVSQSVAAAIVFLASFLGAPISTTDVVAPAIVGVGAGERWHHVRWRVVGHIALAWLVTLPASGLLAAATLPLWRIAS
jgi:inorganic phosphate transporter, PiT family